MRSTLSGISLCLCSALVPLASAAPSATAEEPAVLYLRAQRVIVRPGHVVEQGRVIVRNGKIVAVGADLEKPSGARELEAPVIGAAFFDPWGALGVAPDALSDGSTTAATRAADGIDLHGSKELREETLRAGVTCVRVQAGATARVNGIGAVVRIAPGLERDLALLVPEACVGMSVGLSSNAAAQPQGFDIVDGQLVPRESGTRGMDPFDRQADVDRVTAALETGRNYLVSKNEHRHELEEWQKKIAEKEAELDKEFKKAKKDREKEEKDAKEKGKKFEEKKYKEDKKPQPPKEDEDSEALARAANGDLPFVVQVHRNAELRALLAGTEKQDRLRLLVAGGTESLGFGALLAERRIPVILTPALVGRTTPDELDGVDLSLPARLARAGVEVLIGSGGDDPAASRDLPLLAQLAVGNGLPLEQAFEALTVGGARAFDLADRIGSVERGKDAELLLLDGEPLTLAGRVRYVVSAGRVVVSPEN
jgi:imidazolonepropionase-like amidohydrolase